MMKTASKGLCTKLGCQCRLVARFRSVTGWTACWQTNTGEKNRASVSIVLLNACKGSDPLVKGFSPSSFILGSACTLYRRSKCIWGGLTRSSRPNSS
ncbi:hypothetical protein Peur_006555 [Populus x canadensis]